MGGTTTGEGAGTAAMEGLYPDDEDDEDDGGDSGDSGDGGGDNDDDYDDFRNKSSFDNGGGFSGGRLKTAGTSSDPALGSSSSSASS